MSALSDLSPREEEFVYSEIEKKIEERRRIKRMERYAQEMSGTD